MRCYLNVLVAMIGVFSVSCFLFPIPSFAQTPTYHRGRTPSAEEIRAWDISIGPEGKELPAGSGTAQQGAAIYAQKCAGCHGPTGAEGPTLPGVTNRWPYSYPGRGRAVPPLRGGKGTLQTEKPARTIGSFWPFATTVWDYINRAMPPKEEGTLSADQVYALTAFLLYQNGVIRESDVVDAKTLPQIQMPNHDYRAN